MHTASDLFLSQELLQIFQQTPGLLYVTSQRNHVSNIQRCSGTYTQSSVVSVYRTFKRQVRDASLVDDSVYCKRKIWQAAGQSATTVSGLWISQAIYQVSLLFELKEEKTQNTHLQTHINLRKPYGWKGNNHTTGCKLLLCCMFWWDI